MQSSSKLYLSRLDHLRFLAAFMVLFWHTVHRFIPVSKVPNFFPLSLFEEGHTGVALFMVLSGFIFMAICRDKEVVYGNFIRNRVLRIAPLFLFWLTLQILTLHQLDLSGMILSILKTEPGGHLPGVGWTILVEFQFYLLFPFLMLFFRSQGITFLFRVLLVAVVFRLMVYIIQGGVQTIAYNSIFGRIDQFLLGMIFCELYHRRPSFFSSPLLFGGAVLGWLLLVHGFNVKGGYYGTANSRQWILIPTLEGAFYGLWTACWLACPIRLPRWIDGGLGWMGKLSFSFYLNHVMVIGVCSTLTRRLGLLPTSFDGAILFTVLVVLPMTTLLSALTYHVIELPFLSMRRTYLVAARTASESPARLAA